MSQMNTTPMTVNLLGKEYMIALAPDEVTRVVIVQRNKRLWQIASEHVATTVLRGLDAEVFA